MGAYDGGVDLRVQVGVVLGVDEVLLDAGLDVLFRHVGDK
ncbi:hypothetical protein HNR06_001835 [Nocardiopsis arvandica]|uniref:Uncharacterized protein n=1 Tax=Nocardiopsis sinuspersici TaxID=501010 RepID=A0A7Z0BIN2_9ACTN|nr:hypothetical protein [Nocardiopsis sinuspersici]